ncbi:MAG: PIN domain-containing protein [Phycisphaerales bacterium]
MTDPVIDSAVIIDYMHEHAAARAFLDPALRVGEPVIHTITAAEVLMGARNAADLRQTNRFLRQFALIAPTADDSLHSLQLLRGLKLSHGIGWPDCLIAATCLRLGHTLATTNVKHFRAVQGLRVVRPY